MSPTPRRKITGARPTAIGAKATTPSQASRTIASRDMRKRAAEERDT
jgi:hypothetical protein